MRDILVGSFHLSNKICGRINFKWPIAGNSRFEVIDVADMGTGINADDLVESADKQIGAKFLIFVTKAR